MKKIRDGFILMLVLSLIGRTSSALAQDNGNLIGTITAISTGEPVVSVKVLLSNKKNEELFRAITDENGKYKIQNIPAGTYRLVATFSGYEDVQMDGVIIMTNKYTIVDVELKRRHT